MRRSIKGMLVAGSVVAAMSVGTGVAYAFVAASGSGAAAQSTVASQAYTLQVTVSQVTLTPGVAQTVTVTVTNQGPAKVKVTNAVLSLPGTVSGVDPAALATVSLTQPAAKATVLDKAGSTTFTGSILVEDSATVDQTSLLGKDLQVTANVS
ncbi:MAG: hypothetical protein ACJ786_26710 [Catenulispora sp.]